MSPGQALLLMLQVVSRNTMDREWIQEKVRSYLKDKDVQKAVLFGSRARGTQTKRSDVDLLLVVETDRRWFKRFDDFEALYDLFPGYHLELFIYTPDEIQSIAHRPFMESIMNEGIVIYESRKEHI